MFLKNFACYILFSYQCSSLSATAFIYYHLLLSLSTTFFNFFWFVFALSKKALKTHLFCWFVVAVFSNLGYYTPWSRQKSTPFFKIFSKWHFDWFYNFCTLFLCTLYIVLFLFFNTALFTLPWSQENDDYIVFRGRRTTNSLPLETKDSFILYLWAYK